MNMEKKFRKALVKVLADGVFKNARALALEAEVDQGGLSRFLNAMKQRNEGEPQSSGDEPQKKKITKNNLNLQIVGKLVDCMGGRLVFPWEVGADLIQTENNKLMKENAALKAEMKNLKDKQTEIEQERDSFKTLADGYRSVLVEIKGNNMPDLETIQQNKSCGW